MKNIINWLLEIEHLAHKVYLQAAEIHANDPQFKTFLERMGEDEAWHHRAIGNASEFLATIPNLASVISIDREFSDTMFHSLHDLRDGLNNKTLSRKELLVGIVELERSEWNDIFLYIVNVLKEKSPEFKHAAAKIQLHIKEIEYFLETIENDPDLLKKIKKIPSVWTENILIVDDEQTITDLIRALLYSEGNIDVAHNGQEAIELINNKYYKLIISDIEMPIMDGLTFFKKTVSKFPVASKRFLFMSGDLPPEKKLFLERNKIQYLTKPMQIMKLKNAATQIMLTA